MAQSESGAESSRRRDRQWCATQQRTHTNSKDKLYFCCHEIVI